MILLSIARLALAIGAVLSVVPATNAPVETAKGSAAPIEAVRAVASSAGPSEVRIEEVQAVMASPAATNTAKGLMVATLVFLVMGEAPSSGPGLGGLRSVGRTTDRRSARQESRT